MGQDRYYLEPYSDFIFLLRRTGESKSILQKRFKRHHNELRTLFDILGKIDELGYADGMEMAFDFRYTTPIRGYRNLNLIEIRVRDGLWRVITYDSKKLEKLVMLDAFENHRSTTMEDMVERTKDKVPIVKELLGEVD